MNFSRLNKTNIMISEIGFGTNAVGGHNLYANVDEGKGREMIQEALRVGVKFFDTADAYGFGRSEEIVGEALKEKRSDVVIATKGAIERLEDGTTRINNQPSYLRSAVENSLKRLNTDYIDLYYIHFPDVNVKLYEAVGELSRLKEEGKIRAIGISNVNLQQLKEANLYGEVNAVQCAYNMLDRSVEEEILPYCKENDISFIPYGPLAFGILGGKYTKDFTPSEGDWRQSVPLFAPKQYGENIAKVEKLKQIAYRKEMSVPNLALSWLLAQNGVNTIIPGGKRPEQIRENVKASEVRLSEADLLEIHNILAVHV